MFYYVLTNADQICGENEAVDNGGESVTLRMVR